MLVISFQNSAGELDSRTVKSGAEVAEAIEEMLGSLETFYTGDKIVITNTDED